MQNEELSESSEVSTIEESEKDFLDQVDDHELNEMVLTVQELAFDYVDENILQMIQTNFRETLIGYLVEIVSSDWLNTGLIREDGSDQNNLYEFIETQVDDLYEQGILIPRSYKTSAILSSPDIEIIGAKILALQNVEQPEQRTQAWYEFRHSLISASSLSKCFGSDAQINSLIYEKCKPFEIRQEGPVNTESPMHWGQKYEPLSVNIYELLYGTKLGEFGCIRHRDHEFIGASPDGINIDPNSERYGRMVEIKNPVNRELNGIPKPEYWVQMQIQMETCDLDECDFLETVFKEYLDEDVFYQDPESRDFKGIILHFVQRVSMGDSNALITINHNPRYEYMPLDAELEKESIDKWIQETRMLLRREWSLYEVKYWYLEDYSCITVPRNRSWFKASLPKIQETWNTILKERDSGYEHRASKKRVLKQDAIQVTHGQDDSTNICILNMPKTNSVCLVKLGGTEGSP
jgi:putative phage-type endonuclease